MSESDSFIREVSEEVRRERFSELLRRYGWIGALVILAIVGGAALNEWRKAREAAAAEAAGDALRAAYVVEEPAARAEALAAVAGAAGGAAVARLAEAGAFLEAGDRAGAAEVLAAVAEAPETPPVYRDLALIERVALLGDEMDRSERLATLETLAREEGPFRPLALEQRALAMLETGDLGAARTDLEAVLALPSIPEGLAGRARQLLIALGGTPPGTPGEPAADG